MITNDRKISAQELDERVERAVENFMAGYGCCQSVVAAFADLYGMDDIIDYNVIHWFCYESIVYDFIFTDIPILVYLAQ